jgi:hypothetical protein
VNSGVPNPVNSPRSTRIPAEHARHDRLIVTRFAADDSYPTEIDEARQLVTTCSDCARLADDIGLLMAATAKLPAAQRPRDFRITHEQAESLRGSFLERLLRPLAAPRLAALRPVAGAAMSLGLALVVAGVALPTPSPAGAPADPGVMMNEGVPDKEVVAPAAPDGAAGEAEAPDDSFDRVYTERLGTTDGTDVSAQPVDQTRTLVLYAGLVLAMISLAILSIVTFARRRSYDRLLR